MGCLLLWLKFNSHVHLNEQGKEISLGVHLYIIFICCVQNFFCNLTNYGSDLSL